MDRGHRDGEAPSSQSRLRTARSGALLNLIRRGQARTTSELAAQMGWARSTVAERVDRLTKAGLVKPTTPVTNGRGRPATVLEFNGDGGAVLAVQVGVSGTRVAVTNLDAQVRWSRVLDLGIVSPPDRVVTAIHDELVRACDEIGVDPATVYGIGIGLPGKVELATAAPAGPEPNSSWLDYPIARRLSAAFGVPAYVDQDVNLLALGEQRTFWPDADVFVCVKVGTVIGCGLVINGSVVRGAAGLAGEIGHTHVPGRDDRCACGNRGCLNVVAGGGALAATLSAAGHDAPSARDVARLAREGVVEAAQAVRAAGRDVGTALASVINLLNPEVITVWGYLADAEDHLFTGIRESIYHRAVPAATSRLRVERARFGDEAGIHGAAMAVIEEVLEPETVDDFLTGQAAATTRTT
ncbi:ROK family transcriptional regulator [Haloactinopolyspora sp.]|uniref:ROK family transcriptional regulator n=1 Tax=Haloactinopolyspora sp. TaxID=1966353 RepID=UPI002623BDD2|nr:ROK family transcriptional regulator [Haloactinopolyspora sp.]